MLFQRILIGGETEKDRLGGLEKGEKQGEVGLMSWVSREVGRGRMGGLMFFVFFFVCIGAKAGAVLFRLKGRVLWWRD